MFMTKKTLNKFIITTALATFVSAGIAHAQTSRIYVAGYKGLNSHTENQFSHSGAGLSGDYELDNAFTFAGALGLRLDHNWRIEGEVSYRRADFDRVDLSTGSSNAGGDLGSWFYLANVYYDFDYKWREFQPFVTAGLGLAYHDLTYEDLSGSLTDTNGDSFDLAWQAGAGVKYRYSDNMAFTGNYRYLATSELNVSDFNADYSSHELRFGVEYDLPVATFDFMRR